MPTTRWRRRLVALLALPALLLLAGCGRFHATFTIEDSEHLHLAMDVAFTQESAEQFLMVTSPEELCTSLSEEDPQFSGAEPYGEEGYWGCRLTTDLTVSDMGSGFSLTESGGELHLVMEGDESVSTEDLEMAMSMLGGSDFELSMTFVFPGKVLESNVGTIDGNSVTVTTIEEIAQGIDITAKSGSFPWWIVAVAAVLGLGLLLLLAAVAAFLLLRRRSGSPSGTSAGAGAPAMMGASGQPGGAGYPGAGQQGGAGYPGAGQQGGAVYPGPGHQGGSPYPGSGGYPGAPQSGGQASAPMPPAGSPAFPPSAPGSQGQPPQQPGAPWGGPPQGS